MAALTRDDQPSVGSQKLIGNHYQVCNRSQGSYAQILQSKILLGVWLSEFFYTLVLMTYLAYLSVGTSHFSHVWLVVTLWIVAHQASLSWRFSRQEYWSGLLWPPPGDLSNPGVEPTSLISPALAGEFFTTSATWEAPKECSHQPYSYGFKILREAYEISKSFKERKETKTQHEK